MRAAVVPDGRAQSYRRKQPGAVVGHQDVQPSLHESLLPPPAWLCCDASSHRRHERLESPRRAALPGGRCLPPPHTKPSHAPVAPHPFRRELGMLLLEDPDQRLYVPHAQALLQMRLALDAPPVAFQSALTSASPVLALQSGAAGDWRTGIVRLDVAAARSALAATGAPLAKASAAEDERLAAAIAAAWPDAEVRMSPHAAALCDLGASERWRLTVWWYAAGGTLFTVHITPYSLLLALLPTPERRRGLPGRGHRHGACAAPRRQGPAATLFAAPHGRGQPPAHPGGR